MTVLLIQSQYQYDGMPPSPFEGAVAGGRVRPVRELSLSEEDFAVVSGLITTTHLDQIGFLRFANAVAAFLARGGRWIFNGHMLRPPIGGLGVYRRLEAPKRGDFALTRLCDHAIFDGIDQKALETNHGVAGFYGRGYNPLPEGAVAINGIGPDHHPIDWVWQRPEGGAILSHAGNEFWGCGDDGATKQRLADRAVAWANGELAP